MRHHRILVIRYSSMGDVLLVSPVFRLLQKQNPAKIDLLTREKFADLYRYNPYLNNVLIHESCTFKKLREGKYSLIIDLQKNLRSIILSLRLRGRRLTYNKEYLKTKYYLLTRRKFREIEHVTSRYIDALKPLNVIDDGMGLDLFLDNQDSISTRFPKGSYIVIAAGGTYSTKRPPISLINRIIDRSRELFIIIGGEDVDVADLKAGPNVFNLSGKTNILQSAEIIRDAKMVITGDTGMMHVAAALQKEILVIWGSTDPYFGFYPFYGSANRQKFKSISITDLECRPCSKYGRDSCPRGHMKCLNSITAESVISVMTKSMY